MPKSVYYYWRAASSKADPYQGAKEHITQIFNAHRDNSVMENWFGIMKTEFFYQKKFETIKSFKAELEEYIHYYNHDRIKQKLKGLSPVQYRTQSLVLT